MSIGDVAHELWNWYVTVPVNSSGGFGDSGTYHEALIAIASVAVVIWTGGLIAYARSLFLSDRSSDWDWIRSVERISAPSCVQANALSKA